MKWWIGHGIAGVLLLWYSVQDIRTRQIRWPAAAAVLLAGLAYEVIWPTDGALSTAGGIAVGAGMAVVSLAAGGALGMGDALTVAACGAWIGFQETCAVLMSALIGAAVFSLFLLAAGKGRKARFPFIPFLAGALLVNQLYR